MSNEAMSVHQFQGRERANMPRGWQDLLDAARTEYDVVAIARDFMAGFDPQEVNRLPQPCRPGKFFEASDVSDFAFAVMQHSCGEDRETAQLVGRLATFFSSASDRLSQILSKSAARQSA
jgi:hypothetical protein